MELSTVYYPHQQISPLENGRYLQIPLLPFHVHD